MPSRSRTEFRATEAGPQVHPCVGPWRRAGEGSSAPKSTSVLEDASPLATDPNRLIRCRWWETMPVHLMGPQQRQQLVVSIWKQAWVCCGQHVSPLGPVLAAPIPSGA